MTDVKGVYRLFSILRVTGWGWNSAGHSCSASWSADNQHMVLHA